MKWATKPKIQMRRVYCEGKCVGVAGYQLQERLSMGKILYLADLITDEAWRGKGIGKHLVKKIEEKARLSNSTRVVLESGMTRVLAHINQSKKLVFILIKKCLPKFSFDKSKF